MISLSGSDILELMEFAKKAQLDDPLSAGITIIRKPTHFIGADGVHRPAGNYLFETHAPEKGLYGPIGQNARTKAELFFTDDGLAWGVWCYGHVNKERFVHHANIELSEAKFFKVTDDQVMHTYAEFNIDQLECRLNVATANQAGSFPITWVPGDELCPLEFAEFHQQSA